MAVCLDWEKAARDAKGGNFTESQARKIVSTISERAGLGPVEFATTKEFFVEWIESKEVTKASGTAKRYRHTVESFIEHLGKRAALGLASVRPKDIAGFRDSQVKEGKSAATANMVVKTLRIPFNRARREGIILTNPAEAVDMLTSVSATRTTFSREQIKAMLEAADDEWKGMILLGACHGLRIGDAARLTWENIHAERQTLRFIAEKTKRGSKGKVEEYPLHSDVQTYLEELKVNDNPKAPIFPNLSKRNVSGDHGLSLTFRRLMAKAGIHAEEEADAKSKGKGRRFFSLGFHSLRHTAISEQANQGISKEVRMKLSGHKSSVHDRYTHHELKTLKKEIDKVPSFLN
jgi:integrase